MHNKNRGHLSILIIVALVVGAIGGMFGSFFLKPYLESTDWGRAFLQSSVTQQLSGQTRVYRVTEESATIEAVQRVSPSVVSIVVTKELEEFYNLSGPGTFDFWDFGLRQPTGETKRQQVGGGTGFVIDANGLILTNKHVVVDDVAEYTIVFNDGTQYEAQVLGRDPVNDIAILKIEATELPVIELGDSDKIQIGQTVIAIGNSLSEYQNTVTRGVISGVDRQIVAGDGRGSAEVIEGALQTDAAINPGNSGGPLLNLDGQVIGINTAVNAQGQSIGFAIPISQAVSVINSVREHGRIVRPWLGVRYVQLNEQIAEKNNIEYDYGALIVSGNLTSELAVILGSPADKAGLVEDDIILEINNEQLNLENSLLNTVARFQPGDTIQLKVAHEGEEKIVSVTLTERED